MGDYISRDMAIARLTKVEVINRLTTIADAKREIAEMPAAMLGGTVGFLVLAVIVGGGRGDR